MSSKFAIGVDLGASNIRVGLISEDGKIVESLKEPTNKSGKNGTAVTKQIIRMIKDIQAKKKQGKKIKNLCRKQEIV